MLKYLQFLFTLLVGPSVFAQSGEFCFSGHIYQGSGFSNYALVCPFEDPKPENINFFEAIAVDVPWYAGVRKEDQIIQQARRGIVEKMVQSNYTKLFSTTNYWLDIFHNNTVPLPPYSEILFVETFISSANDEFAHFMEISTGYTKWLRENDLSFTQLESEMSSQGYKLLKRYIVDQGQTIDVLSRLSLPPALATYRESRSISFYYR